jgi:hypothetical protein
MVKWQSCEFLGLQSGAFDGRGLPISALVPFFIECPFLQKIEGSKRRVNFLRTVLSVTMFVQYTSSAQPGHKTTDRYVPQLIASAAELRNILCNCK